MALSIVSWHGEHDGRQEFDAEIGSNRYYAWGIGSGATKHDGVRLLAARSLTSPLLGPLEPGARGRLVLQVPSDAFTEEHHHLQLLSFRDDDLRGPAASDLVEVPWRRIARPESEEPMISTPPAPPSTTWNARAVQAARSVRPASRPVPRPVRMSHAQFLDALAGVISQVLPIVRQALPIVEQVGKMIAPAPVTQQPSATTANPGATGGTAAAAPNLGQLLTQLLAQIQRATAPVPAPPANSAAAHAPDLAKTSSRPTAGAHRYSYAAWAPLLAALPALAPVLQNVLSPQTVQSLIQAGDPTKMLQTTIAGLMDAARIGQQATDQLHAHLRALNPGLGDDILIPLLASMSTTASYNERETPRRLSRGVRLELPDLVPVDVGGYPQVAFRYGDDVALPLSVTAPRAIPRARLHVCVKDAQTLDRVAQRTWKFERLEPGRLPQPIILPSAVAHRLTPGHEYLFGITLEWPGKSGLLAATTNQLIRIVGDATFDSLGSGGTPIRLDDVEEDRQWWHRVWADTIDDRGGRLSARLDYEFRLLPGATANRRTRTVVELEPVTTRRLEGTMRAGLGVALPELSRLAEKLTGQPFDEPVVRALSDPSFAAAFDRQATCAISVHGRRRDQHAIWVWPEVTMHRAFLKTPGEVSPETGQVLSFETRAVQVPIPGLAHVLTLRSR